MNTLARQLITRTLIAPSMAVRGWACPLSTASKRFQSYQSTDVDHPRILITGALGQLGQGLSRLLKKKYGDDNVVMSDIVRASRDLTETGPYHFVDVLDFRNIQEVIVNQNIDWVVHFSALLSAVGEKDVPLAIKVNIQGLHNIMELAKMYNLRIFCPSTIGAFGPESPKHRTPDQTVMKPKTIYGVSKVHTELLGEYYHHKFGVDFRCLRLPGVISGDVPAGGGTTDYAVEIFDHALQFGKYECYLKQDATLPMIYVDDCLRGISEMLEAPEQILSQRTYNINAIAFSPEEVADELRKYVPRLDMEYRPDERQAIADSWPTSLDDSNARRDWGWNHHYDMEELVRTMIDVVSKRLGISTKADSQSTIGLQ